MRFEIDVTIEGRKFAYALSLELPEGFREMRVREESLTVDGVVSFDKNLSVSFT